MEYEIWQKEKEDTQKKLDCLSNEDYTQELIQVYSRKLEIIDEILVDLSPQLDDEQYEGTTYYKYEDELKLLEKNEEKIRATCCGNN